ncbi:MAG: hypothetical protein ACRERR_08320 [Moraxellaceae bacterium]
MESKASWDDLVSLVRGLSDIRVGPPVRGKLLISDQTTLHALKSCLESEVDTRLRVENNENIESLAVGETVDIEVSPRLGFGLLLKDVAALLSVQYAKVKEPRRFLLITESIMSSDVVANDHALARYRSVLEFIQMLKRASAFLDADAPALIFIKDGKFEVPVNYTQDDLVSLSLSDLIALTKILPEGTHEKQCDVIMAESVIEMTQHLPAYDRFQYLLAHLPDLKKRFEAGYRLFASGFSYEKVRDQVEAARVEYTGKIHKVLSDIQNQLLGIPVATVIVATQMKDAEAVGYAFWVNSAVLLGCWIFAILMVFMLHNQSHTLGVLRDEVARQQRQLKNEFSTVAENFSATFVYLSKRIWTQRAIILTVDILVVCGLFLSHIIYFKLTPTAYELLKGLWT